MDFGVFETWSELRVRIWGLLGQGIGNLDLGLTIELKRELKRHRTNLSCRIIFIRDYTLKSLRLKQDKWNKLIISDEQRSTISSFVEKGSVFSCEDATLEVLMSVCLSMCDPC